MKKSNIVDSHGDTWKITKPNRVRVFRDVTILFVFFFIVFSYFFTNHFSIQDPVIIARNISIPFVVMLVLWFRKWRRYKRNVNMTVVRHNDNTFFVNGELFEVNKANDYIKVVVSGNRVGTALYNLYLIIGRTKIFVAGNVYENEYVELISSLSAFMNFRVEVLR